MVKFNSGPKQKMKLTLSLGNAAQERSYTTKLEQEAARWETTRFPDKFNVEYAGNIYAPPDSEYFYFGPSHHVEAGLITQQIIDDFVGTDKTLLSIGSGAAFLEMFLIEQFGICQSRIVLSDINKEVLPESFRSFQFDMDKKWPLLDETFDYILFPESVLCNVKYDGDVENQSALKHYITSALHNLKKGGEIRINGHCQDEERIDVVRRELEQEYTNVQLTSSRTLIEIKKG